MLRGLLRQPALVLAIIALLGLGGVVTLTALRWDGATQADSAITLSRLGAPEATAAAYEPDGTRLRFAVAPVLSPLATLESYGALAEYLTARLGRRVELVQGKSYAEINAMVRSGDAALALVCSGAFVVGRQEFGMEALAVPVVGGETVYRSYLVVPADSTVRLWSDLRQRTFAFTDPLSNTGRLVPVYVLKQVQETPDSFFKGFIFTYSHDKSIEAVAEGLVDGAAVDSLVYDFVMRRNPGLAARTRVVWESPSYGIGPVAVHPDLPPGLRRQLENTFLGMKGDPEAKEVLERLGIDGFVTPGPRMYDSIEEMLRATGGL